MTVETAIYRACKRTLRPSFSRVCRILRAFGENGRSFDHHTRWGLTTRGVRTENRAVLQTFAAFKILYSCVRVRSGGKRVMIFIDLVNNYKGLEVERQRAEQS